MWDQGFFFLLLPDRVHWSVALKCSKKPNILKINSKSHEPTMGPFVIPNWKGFRAHLPISFIEKESSPIILKMVLGYSLENVPVSKWVRLKVCTKSMLNSFWFIPKAWILKGSLKQGSRIQALEALPKFGYSGSIFRVSCWLGLKDLEYRLAVT